MKQMLLLGATVFLTAISTAAPANHGKQSVAANNTISYSVLSGPVYPIEGQSDQISATADFNDTTGVLQNLDFSVSLESFYGTNAGYLAWLGNGWYYPYLSFYGESVKQDKKGLVIKGTLNFRGQPAPVTIHATRTEDEQSIVLNGSFILSVYDYFLFPPPVYLTPSSIPLEFTLSFDRAETMTL